MPGFGAEWMELVTSFRHNVPSKIAEKVWNALLGVDTELQRIEKKLDQLLRGPLKSGTLCLQAAKAIMVAGGEEQVVLREIQEAERFFKAAVGYLEGEDEIKALLACATCCILSGNDAGQGFYEAEAVKRVRVEYIKEVKNYTGRPARIKIAIAESTPIVGFFGVFATIMATVVPPVAVAIGGATVATYVAHDMLMDSQRDVKRKIAELCALGEYLQPDQSFWLLPEAYKVQDIEPLSSSSRWHKFPER